MTTTKSATIDKDWRSLMAFPMTDLYSIWIFAETSSRSFIGGPLELPCKFTGAHQIDQWLIHFLSPVSFPP
ncbi:unnamed protein product [Calypogeia fissa]